MNEIFVDLTLKEYRNDKEYTLKTALDENDFVIMLGNPGSGKTTLLKHFAKGSNAALYNVRDFLYESGIASNIGKKSYLLIDGFDELRSSSNDKYEPLYKIRNIINDIRRVNSKIKIVLSCRSVDWYDNEDMQVINRDDITPVVFHIQPLSSKERINLTKLHLGKTSIAFLEKIGSYLILDNPQILTMFLESFKDARKNSFPKTKKEIYEKFIETSREKNKKRLKSSSVLSVDEIYKYAGYLAYYNIFAGMNQIDEENILEIADESKGFPQRKLKETLNTNLFRKESSSTFIHRTIAEFLCAKFLLEMGTLSTKRLISLCQVPQRNKIASEYRGVFAWLCCFTESDELFEVDPYGQYVYGDNSLFSISNKKKVLHGIRTFAKESPYFLFIGRNYGPNTFYESKLDDFLISEYKTAKDDDNHYLFLLSDLMQSAAKQSKKLQDFAYLMICDIKLKDMYKKQLLPLLKSNCTYLKNIIEKISDEQINDYDNEILDETIGYLYPSKIKYDKILGYIKKYKETSDIHHGHFSYLRKSISYEHRKVIVAQIFEADSEKLRRGSSCAYDLERFVGDFYYEMLEKESFENTFSLLLQHNEIDIAFSENSWSNISKKIEKWDDKIKQKFYAQFIEFILPKEDGQISKCWKKEFGLRHLENTILPQNSYEILSKMIEKRTELPAKKFLLRKIYEGMRSNKNTSKIAKKHCTSLAKQYGLVEFWKNYWKKDPEIAKIESEGKKIQAEHKDRLQNIIKENEASFSKLKDAQKKEAWKFFLYITPHYLFENKFNEESVGLTKKTYRQILELMKKNLLKNIGVSPYKEYLSLDSLAQYAPGAGRNIDELYYACLCLNSSKDYKFIRPQSIKDYLYISSLLEKRISPIKKNSFNDFIERQNPNKAASLIVEFIKKIIHYSYPEKEQIFSKIISELTIKWAKKDYLKNVKNLTHGLFSSSVRECAITLFKNVINNYGFALPDNLIKEIGKIDEEIDKKTQILLKLYKGSNEWSIDDAVLLFNMLDDSKNVYNHLSQDNRFNLVNIFLCTFNNEQVLGFHSGIQSSQDMCAWFVNYTMWNQMIGSDWISILQNLKDKHPNDYWTNRIQNKIYELEIEKNKNAITAIDIKQAKEFIFSKTFSSERDFWAFVSEKLNSIKGDIENGEDNPKTMFIRTNGNENECRDIIILRWQDRYGKIATATREHLIGDNRVDINIKWKDNDKYTVRVECKVDKNPSLKTAVNDQLIKKYLEHTNVNYGIYLVFCFKKDPRKLQKNLEEGITDEYKNKIDIICIDLRC